MTDTKYIQTNIEGALKHWISVLSLSKKGTIEEATRRIADELQPIMKQLHIPLFGMQTLNDIESSIQKIKVSAITKKKYNELLTILKEQIS